MCEGLFREMIQIFNAFCGLLQLENYALFYIIMVHHHLLFWSISLCKWLQTAMRTSIQMQSWPPSSNKWNAIKGTPIGQGYMPHHNIVNSFDVSVIEKH